MGRLSLMMGKALLLRRRPRNLSPPPRSRTLLPYMNPDNADCAAPAEAPTASADSCSRSPTASAVGPCAARLAPRSRPGAAPAARPARAELQQDVRREPRGLTATLDAPRDYVT